jgi:subtilisin family serine protease
MVPLELAKLTALMERTSGSPEVKIGLIDGPVATQHPDLAGEHLREIPGNNGATCAQANSTACLHGTFVAGILSAKRNSLAPAICPNCTLYRLDVGIDREPEAGLADNGDLEQDLPALLAAAGAAAREAGTALVLFIDELQYVPEVQLGA